MGMDPEKNEFTQFRNGGDMEDFIDKFWSEERDAGDDIPIFQMGEELEIRGYIFQVIQINPDRLVLRPIKKAKEE